MGRGNTEHWFHYWPETEERMFHTSRKLTTCELARQIYAKTEDPEIRLKLRILTNMSKSMAIRLKRYEGSWGLRQCPLNPLYLEQNNIPFTEFPPPPLEELELLDEDGLEEVK